VILLCDSAPLIDALRFCFFCGLALDTECFPTPSDTPEPHDE